MRREHLAAVLLALWLCAVCAMAGIKLGAGLYGAMSIEPKFQPESTAAQACAGSPYPSLRFDVSGGNSQVWHCWGDTEGAFEE